MHQTNLLSDSRMILLGFYTSDPYDDEGVPILRITDIQEDHFFSHWDSPKFSRPEEEIDKFYVKNGDFLFP